MVEKMVDERAGKMVETMAKQKVVMKAVRKAGE